MIKTVTNAADGEEQTIDIEIIDVSDQKEIERLKGSESRCGGGGCACKVQSESEE